MPKSTVYLALGTNLGERPENLKAAVAALAAASPQGTAALTDLAASPVYETPPWGYTDQPDFLNMVVRGETCLPPLDLLIQLKHLETHLGRVPSVRYGPRLIDIDILFYGDLVLSVPQLTIPHPRLHERAFVLVPLADLAPELVHPLLGKPVRAMLAALDATGVKRYE
jgi:2-amino-4-hydroxy-6-hydroxymethyldihydropteridine diphosphokinase